MFRPSWVEAPPLEARLHEQLKHDEQGHDAAEIAHAPAEPADLADVPRRRNLRQHGVVVDGRELEEDVGQGDQGHPQQEELGPGKHEEAQCRQDCDGGRVHSQPELAAAPGVGPLARDGCEQRNGRPRNGQRSAEHC